MTREQCEAIRAGDGREGPGPRGPVEGPRAILIRLPGRVDARVGLATRRPADWPGACNPEAGRERSR
jgi:hypothetical protein